MAPEAANKSNRFSSWPDKLYWLVPPALAALQLIYVLAARTTIRDEELAESVRNVFWLDEGLVYDGVSSNVGYYGLLLVVYKLFGFSLYMAKYVRLILYAAAMVGLAAVLQKFMRRIYAAVVLVTVGLAPTILFFNTVQTSYGIDVSYGLICLFVITTMKFDGTLEDLSRAFLLGALAMIAAMSYPSFLFYLPTLAFVSLLQWHRNSPKRIKEFWQSVTAGATGFAVPFLVALSYLKNTREFLNDPVAKAGLFRGGGHFQPDVPSFMRSAVQSVWDVFQWGYTYYYYLEHPDFSGAIGWPAVLAIFGLGVFIARKIPSFKVIFALAGFQILFNLAVSSLADDSGIRRSTGFLLGIYAWYAIVFCALITQAALKKIKWPGLLLCFLLTANSLMHYPANLDDVGARTIWDDVTWFKVESTAERSLQRWLEITARGESLVCFHRVKTDARVPCDYAKIYAALSGYRRWNGLPEIPVRAYDWNTRQERELNTKLWENYYFPH
jgi:hypothetical protein